MWQVYVTLNILEKKRGCDINAIVAVNTAAGRPFLPTVHSACQPIDWILYLVDGRMERGKERKTKAIDINDLPAKRGPQAGASEGPLDTNWSCEAQAFVLILTN